MTRVATSWQAFLRVNEDKTELYEFLAEHSTTVGNGKQVISTKDKQVVCSQHRENITDLSSCEQEEADTRILHAQYTAKREYNRVMVRTVDMDIVVLCVSVMEQMDATELWIAFGVEKGFRYLHSFNISCFRKRKVKILFKVSRFYRM